jgi:hypothetical protein
MTFSAPQVRVASTISGTRERTICLPPGQLVKRHEPTSGSAIEAENAAPTGTSLSLAPGKERGEPLNRWYDEPTRHRAIAGLWRDAGRDR